MFRIGEGYDVHKLAEGRDLILGGVKVPFEKGLLGHSDADVLLHAIMDSLLGAMALGDIGKFFPDNDGKYKDANSLELLKTVGKILNIASAGEDIKIIKNKLDEYEENVSMYVDTKHNENKITPTNKVIICNIDATIICERPKLRNYIDEMRKNIADALSININQVSIKATTEEGLGFTGEGLGIAARAISFIEII